MDVKTRDFLARFKSKLDRLFSAELSAVYLDKMGDHLETFYDDVNDELDTKHINMAKKVDGNFQIIKCVAFQLCAWPNGTRH